MKKRFILFILTLTLVMPTCVFAQEEPALPPINTALSDSLTITPYSIPVYRTVTRIYDADKYYLPPETYWHQEFYNGAWYSGTLSTVSVNRSSTINVWIVVFGGYIYN